MTKQKLIVQAITDADGEGNSLEGVRLVTVAQEDSSRIRLVLDANGTDEEHDVLLERRDGQWLILIHPNGGDPAIAVTITNTRMRAEDGAGRTIFVESVVPVEPLTIPEVCTKCLDAYDLAEGTPVATLCPACAKHAQAEQIHDEYHAKVARLAELEARFAGQGGRGVELADEIDRLRAEVGDEVGDELTAPWYCQSCGHEGTEDDFLSSEVDDLHCCPECGSATEVFPK